jgi:hypothetical protein
MRFDFLTVSSQAQAFTCVFGFPFDVVFPPCFELFGCSPIGRWVVYIEYGASQTGGPITHFIIIESTSRLLKPRAYRFLRKGKVQTTGTLDIVRIAAVFETSTSKCIHVIKHLRVKMHSRDKAMQIRERKHAF